MIRFLGGTLYALLFLIIGSPMLLIENIKRKFNPAKADLSSLHIVQRALRTIWKICGTRLTVIGKEKIPADRPVLYVSNHKSYFDIIIGYSLCPGLTGYIAKDSLEKVPLLRNWMRRLYCLFINRDNPKESLRTIMTATDYIKKGISICIFPEGHRNPDDTLLPFKAGATKIAERTSCPIVPVAVTNTQSILKGHIPFVHPSHVIIEYGDPIFTDGLDRREKKALAQQTSDIIQKMLDKNKELI